MALEAVQAHAGYVLLPSDHYVGGGDGAHDGDMPSLDVAEDGTARLSFVTDRFTLDELRGGDGSAVMALAGRDNFANIPDCYTSSLSDETRPDSETFDTGDAGDRAACEVRAPSASACRRSCSCGGPRGRQGHLQPSALPGRPARCDRSRRTARRHRGRTAAARHRRPSRRPSRCLRSIRRQESGGGRCSGSCRDVSVTTWLAVREQA